MPFWLDLIVETFRGKSLGRILLNRILRERIGPLQGTVLDIAGAASSYERYLDMRQATMVTTNIDPKRKPTHLHDFNTPLPITGASIDTSLLVNAIYIVRDPARLLTEVHRVLKPGGRLYIVSPFVFPYSPEPEDRARYTEMGLRSLADEAGFETVSITPFGGRCSSALALVEPLLLIAPFKIVARSLAMAMDRTVFARINRIHPAPAAYFVSARKPESH